MERVEQYRQFIRQLLTSHATTSNPALEVETQLYLTQNTTIINSLMWDGMD